MVSIRLEDAGGKYHRFARGINAAAMRELQPEMELTARDVVTKHFVGPVGVESKKRPLATKIVSRTGTLENSVAALRTGLAKKGIVAGIKMGGSGIPYARGLEEGATISHPGSTKLQVFKVPGSSRPIFTRKTRAHLIQIRARHPLRKTMKRWKKRHLVALNRGAGQAAEKVGLKAKVS